MKIRSGLHAPSRPCATCRRDVDLSDMPWFQGVVFCSSRCQAIVPVRAPISAVLQTPENGPIVSTPDEDRP
jgi:hypothetical protein